jgi:hypothetical protein
MFKTKIIYIKISKLKRKKKLFNRSIIYHKIHEKYNLMYNLIILKTKKYLIKIKISKN